MYQERVITKTPKYVIKRDGSLIPFDYFKIRQVMQKANVTVPSETLSDDDLDALTIEVVSRLPIDRNPGVEEIQDLVELTLMENDVPLTAKAFILYRSERSRERKQKNALMETFKSLSFSDVSSDNLKRENANVDGNTAMGMMLKYGSESSKAFIDEHILPEDMAEAHAKGDIHIHDKDFYLLTKTCCQLDLDKLFKNGFSTGHGYLREPQSVESYSALACIALQSNQNEMHGGQAIPNFENVMAPGVNKTCRKQIRDLIEDWSAFSNEENLSETEKEKLLNLDFDALCKKISDLENSLKSEKTSKNTKKSNKVKTYEGLENLSFAELLPELTETDYEVDKENKKELSEAINLKTSSEIKHREQILRLLKIAKKRVERSTYQAMQSLVHNLNTMNSRAGAQVPFTSINYGTGTSEAARLVIKQVLQATEDGLGNGETAIFPVQIFKVKDGVNSSEGDPNYDLFKRAMEVSAQRLFPNFSFLDAPFNLQYYCPGDDNSEVAYMGCRTRVMGNVYDPNKEVTKGRGNLSFTSINLPRLGIEARGNEELFFELLDKKMDLVFRQLRHRFEIQRRKLVRNYPFLMGQGIWIESENLQDADEIDQVIRHGTLSVGFIGLAETLVALRGQHHGQSKESQALGTKIVSHMRKRCDEQSQKEELNYTLIGTPAEGLSGRFVRMDRERYGVMEGITNHEFYTNSFHVPVYYPIKAMEKINIEAPYHEYTNAGHITYVEMDGDPAQNLLAFEEIILHMKNAGIGYGSVNHPIDRDPVCGYTGIINDVCPRCGRHESAAQPFERIRRITGYLVGTLNRFNDAKKAEVEERVKHA